MRTAITVSTILLLFAPLLADTVVLKNGDRLDGVVVDRGKWIEVRVSAGSIWVMRRDVARIIHGEPKWLYVRRILKTTRQDDVDTLKNLLRICLQHQLSREKSLVRQRLNEALKLRFAARLKAVRTEEEALALAAWARAEGLTREAKQANALRWEIHIRCALSTIDRNDPAALLQLAAKLKAEGVPDVHLRLVYQLVLQVNPDSVAARTALGLVLFEGNWLTPQLVSQILKQRHEQEMADAGFVFHNGKWVRPDALALLEKERRLANWERRLQQKESLLQQREQKLNAREATLNRRAAYLQRRLHQLNLKEQQLLTLQQEVQRYTVIIVRLRRERDAYRTDCTSLQRRYEQAISKVERLQRELERLRAENDSLRRQLNRRTDTPRSTRRTRLARRLSR